MITYISAYLDIKRDTWKCYSRSFDMYLKSFKPFIELFSSDSDQDQDMILYLESKYISQLQSLLKPNTRIKIIEIDIYWVEKNLYVWSLLEREKEIMKLESFKNMINHRNNCPETYIPEYTLINHGKIDFIGHAIDNNLSDSEYFAWVDFGYFNTENIISTRCLDINKLNLNTINYTLINNIVSTDADRYLNLIYAPEKIGGFFFFGQKDILKKYQLLYHTVLHEYHSMNIADDDQALAIACYFKQPELFTLHYTGQWHIALKYFQI